MHRVVLLFSFALLVSACGTRKTVLVEKPHPVFDAGMHAGDSGVLDADVPDARISCDHEDACRDACEEGNSTFGNPDAMQVCQDSGYTVLDCVSFCCGATPGTTPECGKCLHVDWNGGCGGPDDDGGFEECTCVGVAVRIDD